MSKTDIPEYYEIFLDMDGVIANFDKHLDDHGFRKKDGSPMWDKMEFEWWRTIPPMKGAKAFYDAVCDLGDTYFLTSPGMSAGCFGGKAEWITKFVPEQGKFILKKLTVTTNKHFLARPNRILIDDTPKKIKAWEEAGGIGILHDGDLNATLNKVKATLGKKPEARARARNKPQNRP